MLRKRAAVEVYRAHAWQDLHVSDRSWEADHLKDPPEPHRVRPGGLRSWALQIQNSQKRVPNRLFRIISNQNYTSIITKSVQNLGSLCDFLNEQINYETLQQHTTSEFYDHLFTRNYVLFGLFRKKFSASFGSRCQTLWSIVLKQLK